LIATAPRLLGQGSGFPGEERGQRTEDRRAKERKGRKTRGRRLPVLPQFVNDRQTAAAIDVLWIATASERTAKRRMMGDGR
jgi:hypothetical protein